MLKKSCSQRSVLMALLRGLVVIDLLRELNQGGVNTFGYMDDITILMSGKFRETVSNLADPKTVQRWCKKED